MMVQKVLQDIQVEAHRKTLHDQFTGERLTRAIMSLRARGVDDNDIALIVADVFLAGVLDEAARRDR